MTRTGEEYVKGLRDGRRVYVDGELVKDVTSHPAFRGAVQSVGRLYDVAADPAVEELMTFESPRTRGRVNRAFMIPRSEQDLVLRGRALRHWAECSYGLLGRGPDHLAGFMAGWAGRSDVFARGGDGFGENIVRFYEYLADNDLYLTAVIVPPQIDRSKPAHQHDDPFLYAGVSGERDGGVVIRGVQMLGTAAVLSDYVLLSCIVPLQPGDEAYAMSVAIPVGAPGVKVYSRRSYAAAANSVFDYPLSSRSDETDSLLVFDEVFVPWERVFVYRNLEVASAQWAQTPAHLLGNNQAQIRFSTKLDFLTESRI